MAAMRKPFALERTRGEVRLYRDNAQENAAFARMTDKEKEAYVDGKDDEKQAILRAVGPRVTEDDLSAAFALAWEQMNRRQRRVAAGPTSRSRGRDMAVPKARR